MHHGKKTHQDGGGDVIRYDDIVDLLIKAQKLQYQYPNTDIACCFDTDILKHRPDLEKILCSVYDRIVHPNETRTLKQESSYDVVKIMSREQIGAGDTLFDDDYEYNLLKKRMGPVMSDHFMFKEHDLEIQQRGGFDFRNKKIKFKKGFDPNTKTVCELYEVDCKLVKHSHMRYYHTVKNKRYQPFNVKPMFDNIGSYDYLEPIRRLSEYHSENSYYKRLLDRTSQHLRRASSEKQRLNVVDEIDPDDRDSIILQYAKCRKNMFVITLWKPSIPAIGRFIEMLEQEGDVCYVKTVNLTLKGLRNLMYWYYDDFSQTTALKFIDSKLQYVDAVDDSNPVCVILFDNVNNKKISGQGAQYKQYLRRLILDLSGVDPNKYRGNDMMHINDYFYQTIEYAQLLLNTNSLSVLNDQDVRNYVNPGFTLAHLKMQTLRNVMYSNMSLLELDRVITVGGTVFYAHAMRAFNDVDAVVVGIEPNQSPQLIETVEHFFSNRSSKFYFLDAAIQGSRFWNDSWTEKDQPILDFLKIHDFKDLALDPKNFFYFQGVKMVTLEYEMIRKLIRNRTEDHVDFMMMNLLDSTMISDYVKLIGDENNFNPPYFEINQKYKKIAGEFDDRFPGSKIKILKRRYTPEQIQITQKDKRFKIFFGSDQIVEPVISTDAATDTSSDVATSDVTSNSSSDV